MNTTVQLGVIAPPTTSVESLSRTVMTSSASSATSYGRAEQRSHPVTRLIRAVALALRVVAEAGEPRVPTATRQLVGPSGAPLWTADR